MRFFSRFYSTASCLLWEFIDKGWCRWDGVLWIEQRPGLYHLDRIVSYLRSLAFESCLNSFGFATTYMAQMNRINRTYSREPHDGGACMTVDTRYTICINGNHYSYFINCEPMQYKGTRTRCAPLQRVGYLVEPTYTPTSIACRAYIRTTYIWQK